MISLDMIHSYATVDGYDAEGYLCTLNTAIYLENDLHEINIVDCRCLYEVDGYNVYNKHIDACITIDDVIYDSDTTCHIVIASQNYFYLDNSIKVYYIFEDDDGFSLSGTHQFYITEE